MGLSVSWAERIEGQLGSRVRPPGDTYSQEVTVTMVRLTRDELEAVIIGTEASRLKPLLRPARWEAAASAERKFAALRERGWDR